MAWWTNKTGLAKAAAILATVLGVSLGLCGVNCVAVISFGQGGDNWFSGPLVTAGFVELAGIVLSIVGLVVVAVIAVVRGMMDADTKPAGITLRDDSGKEE